MLPTALRERERLEEVGEERRVRGRRCRRSEGEVRETDT